MPWEIVYGVGALLLLGGLAFGMWRYHTRNKANDAITEAATRAEYKHPETYEEVAEELRKQVKPS